MDAQLAATQRRQLERHRAWGKSKGLRPEQIRPQTLKLYAKLTQNKDSYEFNTQFDQPKILATENRLKRDSLMFVNLVGLALHKVPIFAATEYPFNSPLLFYPDKNMFADAAAAPGVVPEFQCLEAVYNGLISFKTNSTVRLEDYPTNIFRRVPFTQNGAAAQPSSDLELVDISTSFYMSGQTDNKFVLNIGNGDRNGITGGAESANYVCLLLGGFEIVEGAKAALRVDDLNAFAAQN
jgi:hypothetical protein